ncbi:4-hydroxy-3-methylbut-2-enyl diphosphate reductase [Bacilli bacterium]|nr:4-hydroxy-3-methylbut-2-enyl diphosphate reductase [Bacilli bacterium]
MKLKILKPNGWCAGVQHSVNQLNKIINQHPDKQIYLFGDLVHNHAIMDDFYKSGVQVIKDLQLIKNKQAVVVFPAHGVPIKELAYAKANFKYVYDLTCKILLTNYRTIKKLSTRYSILYYGYKNHPESKAILSLNNRISLVSDSSKIKPNKKYALVNQSTIPLSVVKIAFDKLILQAPQIEYFPTTCRAAQLRHNVIVSLRNIDCLLVCGDEKSNNTIELVNLAQQHRISAMLISNELGAHHFQPRKNTRYAIISGTSIQPSFFKLICKILKNKK